MNFIIRPIFGDILFVFGAMVLLLLDFSILRTLFLLKHWHLASVIPDGEIVNAFLTGIRYDAVVASLLLFPVVAAILMPWGLGRRYFVLAWLAIWGGLINFLGVMEIDFYEKFHSRLNPSVFQHLWHDPGVMLSNAYSGLPFLPYLLLSLLLFALFFLGLLVVDKLTQVDGRFGLGRIPPMHRLLAVGALSVMLLLGSQGILGIGPFCMDDSDNTAGTDSFKHHIAINGVYNLVATLTNKGVHLLLGR